MKKSILFAIFIAFTFPMTGTVMAERVQGDIPEDYNALEIRNDTTFRKPVTLNESIAIGLPDDYNVPSVMRSKDRLGATNTLEHTAKFWGPDDFKIE